MERFQFIDRTGADVPRQRPTRPVIIAKEAIEEEIRRLASLPAPANGRRESVIANPEAGAGDGLAPGISVTLSVLKPGERTRPIRHNSAVACFSIEGGGEAVVGANRIRFGRYDVWSIPSWTIYQYANDTDRLQARLTYSNATLLEKLNVHVVEDDPPLEMPSADSSETASREPATFPLRGGTAVLMPYEKLIHPDVVAREPLHWPWPAVKEKLDELRALGKEYVGRRLYLLYDPATGRTNGTTNAFFATITIRPAGIRDRPHRHAAAAINYFFAGSGYSIVERERYVWNAGDLMLTAPGWAVHGHASNDEDVYELTIQDSPFHIAMGSLLWQEDLARAPHILGQTGGFRTNRAA